MLPGFRADPAVLERLVEEHAALAARPEMTREDPTRVSELDIRVHETLAAWGRNHFVRSAVHQRNTLRRLIELGSYRNQACGAVWCREHMSTLAAIAADNMAMAARLMHQHLQHAAEAAEHPPPFGRPVA